MNVRAAMKAAPVRAYKCLKIYLHSVQWDKGDILVKVIVQLGDEFRYGVPSAAVRTFVPDFMAAACNTHVTGTLRAWHRAFCRKVGATKESHRYSTSRPAFFSPMAT